MHTDPESCYQALRTHDYRFDGVFFVGVATTQIYCRTVCTAKTPRLENCTFYPSAAAAEQAGYRPCLRCRPELAPGSARIDAVSRLAATAASKIEDGALTEGSVTELAATLGVSDRHLRRAIESEFGVSPIQLAQTQRLLTAKRLLTDTDLTVTEVAFASGFSSLRRFNALFQTRYRLNPTQLRARRRSDMPQDMLRCELAFRPPLDWQALWAFLGQRLADGVEEIDGMSYRRTVALGKRTGWVSLTPSPSKPTLQVTLSASLAPALVPLLARIKHLCDLAADPAQIAARLGSLAEAHPGLRVPGSFDGFEMAVRAILGQQVSVKAATTLAGRVATAFGEPLTTPFATLHRLTPTAARIAQAKPGELTALGITQARAHSIIALAQAVASGEITLEPGRPVEATLLSLKQLPGIGEWTAQYLALRALAWPDAFPHADLGILKALGETDPKRVLEIAEQWRPWRAYAALHLWKSLEEPI